MSQLLTAHKHTKTLLLFVTAGALLFNAIFWHEKLALNMAIFALFSVTATVSLHKENTLKSSCAKWLLAAVVCSLSMVLIFNSAISSIACLASVILFTAYSRYKHRSPVYAIASAMQSLLYALPQLSFLVKKLLYQKRKRKGIFNKLRIAIIPILITLVFFFVYTQSSKAFSGLLSKLADQISLLINPVFNWIQPQRILFLILGLLISGGLLYKCFKASFQEAEAGKCDDLQRNKGRAPHQGESLWQNFMQLFIGRKANSLIALKYEYKAGMLSLIILNTLLVTVNATDVLYLWMGRQYEAGFAWADYVHEGAELLIVSIIMAMLVVLFFFRRNLNFFRDKKRLLTVAYIWIFQNVFLAASVCLRNYYYITHMALTYKRIGVFVFVLLVFIGLVSVYVKIRYIKSAYYLIKFNAATSLAVLVLASFFQWDVMIAKYNLASKNKIPLDAAFLLTLSDHTLPVLQQYKNLFTNEIVLYRQEYDIENNDGTPVTILDYRIKNFLNVQEKYTWLSWNLADANTKKQLLQINRLSQH